MTEKRKKILFLCTGNSCRSQMAEGLMRNYFKDRFDVCSAGVNPSEVNPNAVNVMKEIGINISKHNSKSVELFLNEKFDFLITVCDNAKELCPVFSGEIANRIHWDFEDPAAFVGKQEEKTEKFREVRDLIKVRIFEYFGQKNVKI